MVRSSASMIYSLRDTGPRIKKPLTAGCWRLEAAPWWLASCWHRLAPSWHPAGTLLASSWHCAGPRVTKLGLPWAILGSSRNHLCPSRRDFGPAWGHPGGILGPSSAILDHLGCLLGHLRAILRHLGVIFGHLEPKIS